MYQKSFFITEPVGNNSFSFDKRKNKKLYVPSLKVGDHFDFTFGNEIVFEDFDFDGELISAFGLKHFYKYIWNGIPLYLFDNHNHAFYFWCEAYKENVIDKNILLYHIDEHADMRIPERLFSSEKLGDLQEVFQYTNFHLNVGNYIVPALQSGLISEVIQIRSESNLYEYQNSQRNEPYILNLDLDFFEPNLDYIDYKLKKQVILDIAKKSKLITVATSPFFIEQSLARKVFLDLFT